MVGNTVNGNTFFLWLEFNTNNSNILKMTLLLMIPVKVGN